MIKVINQSFFNQKNILSFTLFYSWSFTKVQTSTQINNCFASNSSLSASLWLNRVSFLGLMVQVVPNKRVLIWFGPVLWKRWPFAAVRMAADWVQRSPQSKMFLKPLQQPPLLCRQKENNNGIFMTFNTFSAVSTVYLWQDQVTVYCFPVCTTFYSYSTSQKVQHFHLWQ